MHLVSLFLNPRLQVLQYDQPVFEEFLTALGIEPCPIKFRSVEQVVSHPADMTEKCLTRFILARDSGPFYASFVTANLLFGRVITKKLLRDFDLLLRRLQKRARDFICEAVPIHNDLRVATDASKKTSLFERRFKPREELEEAKREVIEVIKVVLHPARIP